MKNKYYWIKYKITFLGLLGSLIFAFFCFIFQIINLSQFILLMLYMPGFIYGLFMAKALSPYSEKSELILLLSMFEYLAMIYFCSLDFEYLVVRRILMGGIGALLFLTSVKNITHIKLTSLDLFFGFCIGILSTCIMWTDSFYSVDPWMIILSIVLWQTFISLIISRRVLILGL